MKGFLIFLTGVFLLLGAVGYYMLTHQDPNSTVVRMNGKWVVIEKEHDKADQKGMKAQ